MRKVSRIQITSEETEAMIEYVTQNPEGINFEEFQEIIETSKKAANEKWTTSNE